MLYGNVLSTCKNIKRAFTTVTESGWMGLEGERVWVAIER